MIGQEQYPTVIIFNNEMSREMRDDAERTTIAALEKSPGNNRAIARYIKDEFDGRYKQEGADWNVIVGKNFAGIVTHLRFRFIHLEINDYNVLLYQAEKPLAISGKKQLIKDKILTDAKNIAVSALRVHRNSPENVAHYIKRELKKAHGVWNVIAGTEFSGFVSHLPKQFIRFNIKGSDYIVILYKSG